MLCLVVHVLYSKMDLQHILPSVCGIILMLFCPKWIGGRGPATSPAPMKWPQEVMTYHVITFFGDIWKIVSKQRFHYNERKAAVIMAFGTMPPAVLRKCLTEHGVSQYYAVRMEDAAYYRYTGCIR